MTTPNPPARPNPGSKEALDAGCQCPVLDNNHGKFPPWPPDGWWYSATCPLHREQYDEALERWETDGGAA